MSTGQDLSESSNSAAGVGETQSPTPTGMYNEQGQIVNPDIAHDIAINENVARDTEAGYIKESEQGMTEQEKTNLEIGAMLYEKYPYAFTVEQDERGFRKYGLLSTKDLAEKDPQASSYDPKNLGQRHKILESAISQNIGNNSMENVELKKVLLAVLGGRSDATVAAFSAKGIEYMEKTESGDAYKFIEKSLIGMPKQDIAVLSRVLELTSEFGERIKKEQLESGRTKISSLEDISALLK